MIYKKIKLSEVIDYYRVTKKFTVTNFSNKITFDVGDELRTATLYNIMYVSCTKVSDGTHAYVESDVLKKNAERYDPEEERTQQQNEWVEESRIKLLRTCEYDIEQGLNVYRADKKRLSDMLEELNGGK